MELLYPSSSNLTIISYCLVRGYIHINQKVIKEESQIWSNEKINKDTEEYKTTLIYHQTFFFATQKMTTHLKHLIQMMDKADKIKLL